MKLKEPPNACALLKSRPEFHLPSICSASLEDTLLSRSHGRVGSTGEDESGTPLESDDEPPLHQPLASGILSQTWKNLGSFYGLPQADLSLDTIKPYQKVLTQELQESFVRFPLVYEVDKTKLRKKLLTLPLPDAINPKKTLILDLDETLVHTSYTGGSFRDVCNKNNKVDLNKKGDVGRARIHVQIRPYLYHFLETLSSLYEIIVYTSGAKEYAEAIVGKLNKGKKYIKHVLHRKHCIKNGNFLIKDLRIIKNRRLQDMIVLDNTVLSHISQLENTIYIPSYKGEDNDEELKTILDFLIKVAGVTDVRPFIIKFAGVKEMYKKFISLYTSTSTYN